jgi:hypothetical protein
VVEGGGSLCYYIHTVSLSTLRCSKLRPLLGPPPRTRMAAETEHDVVTGEQGSPVAGTLLKGTILVEKPVRCAQLLCDWLSPETGW